MSVSASYLEYVLEQLSASHFEITHRKMFGGVGIYADERFVALIADDRLYLKVDDTNRPDFEKEGAVAFQPYGDGSYSMSYFEAPTRVLEDRDELAQWLERSFEAASNDLTSKKKRKKK